MYLVQLHDSPCLSMVGWPGWIFGTAFVSRCLSKPHDQIVCQEIVPIVKIRHLNFMKARIEFQHYLSASRMLIVSERSKWISSC